MPPTFFSDKLSSQRSSNSRQLPAVACRIAFGPADPSFTIRCHADARLAGAALISAKNATWMPRVSRAGGVAIGGGFVAGSGPDTRSDRTFLSLGLFSGRQLPHHSVLARLGKVACEKRRLCVVGAVWAHAAGQQDHPALEPERRGLPL